MTTEELKEWETFYTQFKNGYHLSKHDWMHFIRLNHLVMEASHEIHNENMTGNVNVAGTPNALDKLARSLSKHDLLRM